MKIKENRPLVSIQYSENLIFTRAFQTENVTEKVHTALIQNKGVFL